MSRPQGELTDELSVWRVFDQGPGLVEGLSADAEPFLAQRREEHRETAAAILQEQKQLLRDGDFTSAQYDVDAASYAREYLKETDTARRLRIKEAIDTNVALTLHEAVSKYEPEPFKEIVGYYDPSTKDIMMDGFSQLQRAIKGLSAVANPEMQERSQQEYVETFTLLDVLESGLWRDYDVYTDSPCGITKNGEFVHEIKKGMIRRWWFEEVSDGTILVKSQTIAYDGRLFNSAKRAEIFKRAKLVNSHVAQLPPTETLGVQQLFKKGTFKDTLEYSEWRDRQVGDSVFLGKVVDFAPERHDYEAYEQAAIARRQRVAEFIQPLASRMIDIAEEESDAEKGSRLFHEEVAEVIHLLSRKDSSIAQRALGKDIADQYSLAQTLVAEGRHEEADVMYTHLRETIAQQVGYCGAGSCGLESGNERDRMMAAAKGAHGEVISNPSGHCKSCGAEGYIIVYDRDTDNVSYICREDWCPSNRKSDSHEDSD